MAMLGEVAFTIVAAEAAHRGHDLTSFALGERIVEAAAAAEAAPPPRWPETAVLPLMFLNSREVSTLKDLAAGLVPANIATAERTVTAVENDMINIRRKLRVESDVHAVWLGIELGLPISPTSWRDGGEVTPADLLLLGLRARGWRPADLGRRFNMSPNAFPLRPAREALHAVTLSHAIGIAARRGLLVPDYRLIPQWAGDAPSQT